MRDADALEALLRTAWVGRLGTVGEDGSPRLKPLNFVWHAGRVYFHSARDGEKIRDLRRDGRVCFEVDQALALVRARTQPCRATCLYRSAILRGRAVLVEDEAERRSALDALLEKHQPGSALPDYPPEKLALTAVVRIDVDEAVGKEDLGTAAQRERIVRALRDGEPLPLLLDEESRFPAGRRGPGRARRGRSSRTLASLRARRGDRS